MKDLTKSTCLLLLAFFLSEAAQAQNAKWKFMVCGDTRGTGSADPINTNILKEIAQATTNENPVFLLVPGDLVNAGNLTDFRKWTNIMSPVYQAGIGVYPVMGNHDNADGGLSFKGVFGPSIPDNGPAAELDRTYALLYSNALVLCFDNYITPHQANTNWMKAVLATNTALHVFAMGHEPAFKANHTDCLDDVPAARDVFWNLMRGAACRAYFCGHDHLYAHARIADQDGDPSNDSHQLIVGGGGAPFHTSYSYNGVNTVWTPTKQGDDLGTNGYVIVEIEGPLATLTYKHRIAPNKFEATSDTWSYSLNPVIASTFTNATLALTWLGGGSLQSAPEADGPWTTISNAKSPYSQTDFSPDRTFYRVQLR